MENEFLITIWLIAIVLVINSHIVTSNQRVIEPNELCQTDDECSNTGIKGHVSCVENICICDIDSIFITQYGGVKVCSLNAQLGFECNSNYDCAAKDSICLEEIIACNLTEKAKSCQCPVNHELRKNICEKVIPRLNGIKCCSHNDCNTNFECHYNTTFAFGQCQCKAGYGLYKDQCVSLHEAKICSRDIDCPDNFFCIEQTSEYGTCRENIIVPKVNCKKTPDCENVGYFGHVECQNDYCFCTNSSKQIYVNKAEGCYLKSYYGQKCQYEHDCQDDLECVHQNDFKICQCSKHRILYLNKCVDMPESKYGSLCKNDDECNATGLYCYKNKISHGRCQCNDGLIYFKEQCIKVRQLGLCIDDSDCSTIEYCNKTADNALFGQCSRRKVSEMYDLQNNGDFKTISDEPNSASVKHILLIYVLVLFIVVMIILGIIIFIRCYICRKIFYNRRFGSNTSSDHPMLTLQNRN